MTGPNWRNVYRLSDEQLAQLEQAEQYMEMLDISKAVSYTHLTLPTKA